MKRADPLGRLGALLIVLGFLTVLAAGALYLYLRHEDRAAAAAAVSLVQRLEDIAAKNASRPAPTPSVTPTPRPFSTPAPPPTPTPYTETVIELDGKNYLGTLSFAGYDLELPVLADWDFDALRLSPARYAGSVAGDDLVIAAHNYSAHFGILGRLLEGDELLFIDADGREIWYAVRSAEILPPTAIGEMTSGDWDLTLFTCTYGGKTRVAVRCERLTTGYGLAEK